MDKGAIYIQDTVDLKNELPLDNGGHILYVFNDATSYLENLTAYIKDGIELGHYVVVIDEQAVYEEVVRRFLGHLTDAELQHIYFEDKGEFYAIHADFQAERIVGHFDELTKTLPQEDLLIRTWARVAWKEDEEIYDKLVDFENTANRKVQGFGTISVCAYDASQVSGDFLVKLLKNHDYLMTDGELVRSPLYITSKQKTTFPSLAVQSKMESEIDFYKRKLDFVHVVSHEVRNPLTIINAYANILRNTESSLSAEGRNKVAAIEQYVKVIDHELTNIIQTEQMLSTDLYMLMEVIYPLNIVQDVIGLMSVKANVQNVTLVPRLDLEESDAMVGNQIGLRIVLSNLLSNAIKYSTELTEVRFAAFVQEQQIRFTIKDEGVGMSEDQLRNLFKKYGKFDESRSGQGIGLYMVKSLTDRFKGTIHIHSELGHGTEVVVSFPLCHL